MRLKDKINSALKGNTNLIYIIFGAYLGALLWFTLCNRGLSYTFRVIPPFHSYGMIFKGDLESLLENAENIILFIPMGCFIRIFQKQKWKKAVLKGFLISLIIELIQLITTLGCFEFDDLLHNTLGTVIGWCLWKRIPIRIDFDFQKVKRSSITAAICILVAFVLIGKLTDYVNYQRMVPYAALSDTAEYKNLLVLDGQDGYCKNTDIYVEYQDDGSLEITGSSDRRSWYQIGDIKLDAGTYVFTGLSGVKEKTVALELEYYDRQIHTYTRLTDDVGPTGEVRFTLEKTTKIRAYVGTYKGCNCDVTARPVIYKEEK